MSFLLNPFVFAAAGDFESIATVTVGSGGAADVTFSSIPSGYQHLQVRGFTPFNVRDGVIRLAFNGDTGSNFRYHWLSGNGAAAQAYAPAAGQYIEFAYDANAAPNSSVAKSFVVDILDYASSSKNTTVRTFCGTDVNGGGMVQVTSGLWVNTSAVTSLKFTQTGNLGGYGPQNLAEHSHLALYGIKA